MKSYFLRRLLLIPPTLVGITLLVFTITRFVPGGPLDRMLQEASRGADQGGKRTSSSQAQGGLSEEQLEELEEQFGLDKNVLVAYGQWLGIAPREVRISKGEYGERGDEISAARSIRQPPRKSCCAATAGRCSSTAPATTMASAVFAETGKPVADRGLESPLRNRNGTARTASSAAIPATRTRRTTPPRAVIYQTRFSGLLQGDLGRSTVYNDPVHEMIFSRMPVAVYFGLLTAIITYAVCLPLGVLKALKHRTFIDSASSVLIFLGYSIPGFALGAILLVHLGARMNLVPALRPDQPGFRPARLPRANSRTSPTTRCCRCICYIVGSFAMLTMMTKNNLMDNLAADYVRTAVAKGASFRKAVFGHAFRNSMIPVATSLGDLVTIFIGGSMLIETVFDIQGFGLLQYQSVIARDVPVIMGTLTIAAFLMLIGHVISDFIVAMVDPRIKFE